MSFAEVLEELSALTVEQRQLLICRAIELDERGLPEADEAVVESRLAEHHADPDSSVSLDKIKQRLRSP
jgi:hypothetical protein